MTVRIVRVPSWLVPGRHTAWVPLPNVILWDKNQSFNRRTLSHELAHVNQYRKYGVTFYFRYVWGWARAGFSYWRIPLEVEARAKERTPTYLTWADRLLAEQ